MTWNVAFCFDRNYRQHFGAAVTSLLLNFDGPGDDLRIHVVTDVVDEDFATRIERLRRAFRARIELHPMPLEAGGRLAGVPLSGRFPVSAYWNIALAEILPSDVDRVLYLDSDLIVLKGIRALLDTDLGGFTLGGADDPSSERMRARWGVEHYVNSGVMLIDLARWRERDYTRRCIEFSLAQGERLEFLDQCAINVVLAGDIRLVPLRWNRCVHPGFRHPVPPHSAVVHFITANKPWQAWYEAPEGRHYWRYLDVSPWAGAEPEPPTTQRQTLRMARLLARGGRLAEAVAMYERIHAPPRPGAGEG